MKDFLSIIENNNDILSEENYNNKIYFTNSLCEKDKFNAKDIIKKQQFVPKSKEDEGFLLFNKPNSKDPFNLSIYSEKPIFKKIYKKIKTIKSNKKRRRDKFKINNGENKKENINNKKSKNSEINKRKYMKDMMRKKIKSNFYKNLSKRLKMKKIIFNQDIFPQKMIKDVSKEMCKNNLNMTLEELLKNIDKKEINETFNENKVNFKNEIIKSYDNTKKKDLFNILNKKIEEIYKEYLESEEFKNSIKKLVEEGNFFDYIKDYIEAAEQVVEYYKKRCYKKKNDKNS